MSALSRVLFPPVSGEPATLASGVRYQICRHPSALVAHVVISLHVGFDSPEVKLANSAHALEHMLVDYASEATLATGLTTRSRIIAHVRCAPCEVGDTLRRVFEGLARRADESLRDNAVAAVRAEAKDKKPGHLVALRRALFRGQPLLQRSPWDESELRADFGPEAMTLMHRLRSPSDVTITVLAPSTDETDLVGTLGVLGETMAWVSSPRMPPVVPQPGPLVIRLRASSRRVVGLRLSLPKSVEEVAARSVAARLVRALVGVSVNFDGGRSPVEASSFIVLSGTEDALDPAKLRDLAGLVSGGGALVTELTSRISLALALQNANPSHAVQNLSDTLLLRMRPSGAYVDPQMLAAGWLGSLSNVAS